MKTAGAALLLGWMMAAVTAGCLAFGYFRFRRTFRDRSAAEVLLKSRGGRLLTPEELLRQTVGRQHAGPGAGRGVSSGAASP